jgi:hypothetical protein
MRAAARRVKAGGERFLGGVLPGASARRLQVRAFADEWAADNLDARQATGPLWIVLGDSASQGIGATTRDVGYVGVVHEMLRHRDAWRVINLSRAGAGVADVLNRQLPELAVLTEEEPAALVSCLVGAEDIARRVPGVEHVLRQLIASLPTGTVIGTLARGARSGPAAGLDAVVREEGARHRMRIAELPPRFGPGARRRTSPVLNDVEHAAWAKAVLVAIDSPPAEIAPSTDPKLPVVTASAAVEATAAPETAAEPESAAGSVATDIATAVAEKPEEPAEDLVAEPVEEPADELVDEPDDDLDEEVEAGEADTERATPAVADEPAEDRH